MQTDSHLPLEAIFQTFFQVLIKNLVISDLQKDCLYIFGIKIFPVLHSQTGSQFVENGS